MICYLLDINVLIALIDPVHIKHAPAHKWFGSYGMKAWATCAFTENGVIRIVGSPSYANSPGPPAVAAEWMVALRSLPGHRFWAADISLLEETRIRSSRLLDASLVTDSYLLALAVAHQGRLATFDRRMVTDTVVDGRQAYHLID